MTNGKLVTPAGVLDRGWIEVAGDRIVDVGEGSPTTDGGAPIGSAIR